MRRVSSGRPRKTSSSFSTFLCKAAARSKSSCSLAFWRSSSIVDRSDPPLVSRNCTSLCTSTSYSSFVQPAKHGARHIFISEYRQPGNERSRSERSPARFQELHQPLYFDVVFLLRAARKAWREAHFHFGVQAARKRRIAADLDLAAPHFE